MKHEARKSGAPRRAGERTRGLALVASVAAAALGLAVPLAPWSPSPRGSASGVARAQVAPRSTVGFSDAEREALRNGHLVERPSVELVDGREWLGGVSFQVVDRPIDAVWRALEDIPAYRHMIPGVQTTRLDAHDAGTRLVYVAQESGGMAIQYWLRVRHQADTRTVSFAIDTQRPHDVEGARGFIELRPHGPCTMLTWGVRAHLGRGPVFSLFHDSIQHGLLRVPTTMKRYLERTARDRYVQ